MEGQVPVFNSPGIRVAQVGTPTEPNIVEQQCFLRGPCRDVINWATLFLEKINEGTWHSRFGEPQLKQ
jgi:hypothetical protein